jgi:predicted transcriptional regulator
MRKDKLMETVKALPQEFDLDSLIERLIFEDKVEKGLKQLDAGKTTHHDKVKEMTKKW